MLYSSISDAGSLAEFAMTEINYFFSLRRRSATLVIMIDDPNHVTALKEEERKRRRDGSAAPVAKFCGAVSGSTPLHSGWQRDDGNRRAFASYMESRLEKMELHEGSTLISHCSSRAFEVCGSRVSELSAPSIGEADVAAVHWARFLYRRNCEQELTMCIRTIDSDSIAIGLLLQTSTANARILLWLTGRKAPAVIGSSVTASEGPSMVIDFKETTKVHCAYKFALASVMFGCDFVKKSDWARPRAVGVRLSTSLMKHWAKHGVVLPASGVTPDATSVLQRASDVVSYWTAQI